jgi:hypothetical protein
VENIIWPPNIVRIDGKCLFKNTNIKKVDLSDCIHLTYICDNFCEDTAITDLIFPKNVQHIYDLYNNKSLISLNLQNCTHLQSIGYDFCANTNIQYIKFPRSLQKISSYVCRNSTGVRELDFIECKDVCIETDEMCSVETLKVYSINNLSPYL